MSTKVIYHCRDGWDANANPWTAEPDALDMDDEKRYGQRSAKKRGVHGLLASIMAAIEDATVPRDQHDTAASGERKDHDQ